jgi:hypothetical protein
LLALPPFSFPSLLSTRKNLDETIGEGERCGVGAISSSRWISTPVRSSNSSVSSVLGLIFLQYADHKFVEARAELSQALSGGPTDGWEA